MRTLTRMEEALAVVRRGMDSRSRRISGRVGESLARWVSRPGKMLRARFAIQLGRALGVPDDRSVRVARAMELAHNASLLHDDCVDGARLRRGEPTPNSVFGQPVALLLGDLAFTQALEEALELHPRAVERLVGAAREMTIGELQEEFLKGSVDVTLESYLGIAGRKTGALFEWGAHTLSDLSPLEHEQADPPKLGSAAGILLQIVDDIHDFALEDAVSGKERAKDLFNGRVTLPCVFALGKPASRAAFLKIWNAAAGDPDAPAKLRRLLSESGAVDEARAECRKVTRSIAALARRLPVPDEIGAFASYVDALAGREF